MAIIAASAKVYYGDIVNSKTLGDMITKEQAREIYNYYSQIEKSEKLIDDLKRAIAKEKENPRYPDIIRDNTYHPHGSICLEVPYFDNLTGEFTKEKGSMIYNISYPQAVRVLKAHVKQLKRELAALQPKD